MFRRMMKAVARHLMASGLYTAPIQPSDDIIRAVLGLPDRAPPPPVTLAVPRADRCPGRCGGRCVRA